MILELELAALVGLEVSRLVREGRERRRFRWLQAPARPAAVLKNENTTPTPTPAAAEAPPASGTVEILKRGHAGSWQHVGFRHHSHPDVREALATKGLALRRADGSIREGVS